MCDPVTIAGVALTAGSMVANQSAANKVAKARSGAMAAERIRQGGLQQEADALNAASRDRYNNWGAKEGEKSNELGAYFNQENQPLPPGQTPSGAPTEVMPSTAGNNVVVREQQRQKGKAKAYTDQQGAALGKLRAFGDLLGDTSRLQARDSAQVGTLGGFMKGSSAVLPFELEAANQKGSGMKLFGDILSGAGTLTTAYGLAGGGQGINEAIMGKPMQGPLLPGQSRPNVGGVFGQGGSVYSLFK